MCSNTDAPVVVVPDAMWQYKERSVWFQRKAILIIAIFLSIFIILIIGITVFLHDFHGKDTSKASTISSQSTTSQDDTGWASARRSRHLFRRRPRASMTSAQRTLPAESDWEDLSDENEPSHTDAIQPVSSALSSATTRESDVVSPAGVSPITTEQPVITLSARSSVSSQVVSEPSDVRLCPNTSYMPPSENAVAGHAGEQTMPPSYFTTSPQSSRVSLDEKVGLDRADALQLGPSAPPGTLILEPSAPLMLPTDDSATLTAHVATDEKAALKALFEAGSSPALPLAPQPLPSAPVLTAAEDVSSVVPVRKGKVRVRSRSYNLPDPPQTFMSSVQLAAAPSLIPTASSYNFTQRSDVQQDEAWISMPGMQMPDLWRTGPFEHAPLPLYEASYDMDLERGLQFPSEVPLSASHTAVAPSAPVLDD